jgi:hypothetical protein
MEYQAALGHTQNDNEQRVEVPFAEASLLNSCSLLLSGSHVMSLIVAIGTGADRLNQLASFRIDSSVSYPILSQLSNVINARFSYVIRP